MENCVYDAVGNMLTSTFSDYNPITAMNMPTVKYGHIETPSPHSYSGAKGMGEGGAAPIHTISAALQDALFANGIIIDDSFNNADSLFRAIVAKEIGQAKKLVKMERRAEETGSLGKGIVLYALWRSGGAIRRVLCAFLWGGS